MGEDGHPSAVDGQVRRSMSYVEGLMAGSYGRIVVRLKGLHASHSSTSEGLPRIVVRLKGLTRIVVRLKGLHECGRQGSAAAHVAQAR